MSHGFCASAWRRRFLWRLQLHGWHQHPKAGLEQVENCSFVRLVTWSVLGLQAERPSHLQARPDQGGGRQSIDGPESHTRERWVSRALRQSLVSLLGQKDVLEKAPETAIDQHAKAVAAA